MGLINKFFILCFVVLGLVACTVPQPPIINPPSTIYSPSLNIPSSAPPEQGQSRNEYYPFDLAIDTIAFMDCQGSLSARNVDFFTFKFASYNKGVSLRQRFLKNIAPYDHATINTSIRTSPYLHTKAQISLAAIGDPRNSINASGTQDGYGYFVPPFSNPSFINEITTRHTSRFIADGRPIETVFPMTPDKLSQVTSSFGRSHVFTLTYSNLKNNIPLALTNGVYYGRTYDPILDGGENGKNYLIDIDEKILSTNQKDGNWNCPKSLRALIHRHRSLTQYTYSNNVAYFDENNLTPEAECIESNSIPSRRTRSLLETLLSRNSFIIGETHIFENNRLVGTGEACVVPRDVRTSCYTKANVVRIEFDKDKDCTIFDPDNRCPSYVSVCTRN